MISVIAFSKLPCELEGTHVVKEEKKERKKERKRICLYIYKTGE